MLEHGGALRRAAAHYGRPLADWLDLSTGINPQGWPVPPLPAAVWQRLPEEDDGLEDAARAYYANPNLVAVAGSQVALETLPTLFPRQMIACLGPLYAEHPAAWQRAGHRVRQIPAGRLDRALAALTPLVLLCNPNNPGAQRFSRQELLAAAAQLQQRGGSLIVDEAFIDATPEDSVADLAGSAAAPRLVVLRSLGKFFGLAGLRAGFLLGAPELCESLRHRLSPWHLSHPSRWVATQALRDQAWQAATREQLHAASSRLQQLFDTQALPGFAPARRTPLFVWLAAEKTTNSEQDLAATLAEHLATHHGILVRRFPDPAALRIGLPGDEAGWARLTAALTDFPRQV
ncbi:MAG: hypothetical protein RIR00_53 [Pseudomonadota bacterium]|jgi:cobalamin biosynthetic protein CobC